MRDVTCEGYKTTLGLVEFHEKVMNKMDPRVPIVGKRGGRRIVSAYSSQYYMETDLMLQYRTGCRGRPRKDLTKAQKHKAINRGTRRVLKRFFKTANRATIVVSSSQRQTRGATRRETGKFMSILHK